MAVAWSATRAVETRVAATVAAAGEAAAAAAARVETAGWRRRGGGGGVTGRGGLEARVRAYGMPEEGVGGGGREAARSVRARNGSGSGFEPRRREGGQRASVWRVEVTVARRG